MQARFVDTLNSIGKKTELWESPDGSRVALLPYGARVIGLFAPGSDENFLWTHPALESVEQASALYASDDWHDSGGDRTWLTPELDIFFPNYPDTSVHCAPGVLDASDYEVVKTRQGLGFSKQFSLKMARPAAEVAMELSKSVAPAANPLRWERDFDVKDRVEYAGYTLHTSLKLPDDAPAQVGLWNLLQMPHGGDMLIPTYSKTEPRVLFGDIKPENLVAEDNLVRFRIVTKGEHKIALRAVAVTGRAGYLWQSKDKSSLVIRNFNINPSDEYVDIPKNDLDDFGYAFHAVSVDSALGAFCELEYHVPAVGQGTNQVSCEDTSQVWAFRGSKEDITLVAKLLLSPGV